jgi:hypothetical protein
MKLYKIRHIPTKLFYTPTKGRWRDEKTNIHERGKVYEVKPSFNHLHNRLDVSWNMFKKYNIDCIVGDVVDKYKTPQTHQCWMYFKEEDWEIVEYDLIECLDKEE